MVKTIAVIGDSNSSVNDWHISKECWPTYLQNELSENIKVENWSIPGSTLHQGYWMIGNVFRNVSYSPDMVIIALGINDVQQKNKIENCAGSLKLIFDVCVKNKSVILLGKTDASSTYFMNKRGEDYTKTFTQLYDIFAAQYKADLFDFITPKDLDEAKDHIHPGEEWHKSTAKKVANIVIKQFSINSKDIEEST